MKNLIWEEGNWPKVAPALIPKNETWKCVCVLEGTICVEMCGNECVSEEKRKIILYGV